MEEIIKQNKNKSHEEFEKLLSEDLNNRGHVLKEGSILNGLITRISKKHVFVDISAKSEGAIPIEEFKITQEINDIKIGSRVEVFLERIENRAGEVVISREKAARKKSWNRMKALYKEGKPCTGIIKSRIRGGMIVDSGGCLMFLPSSQIALRPLKDYSKMMNIPLQFLIVKMDERRGNLVCSHRQVLEKIRNKDREKYMKDLKEGMILKDCVCKSLQSWGAFFSYGSLDLLVHINEISWSRVTTPSDLLQVGQTCDIFLHKIEGARLSGSLKRLQPDPFIEAAAKYKPGDIVENCVVLQIRDYGAFISVAPNLVGLVHVSCLDHLNPSIHPSKVVSVSEKISVKILSLDVKERKLSLSYKDTFPSPWITFKKKYKEGSIVNCKIKQKNDYAIFCFIEDTPIVGMLHISNLTWAAGKEEEQLKRYHKNDTLRCKIYEVNDEKMKTQLSLKHLDDDPYDFFMNKKVSDIVTVVCQSSSEAGIYVRAGKNNFPILIKRHNLAKEIGNCRPSRFSKGMKVDAMIVEKLDKERKIVLSIKALEEKQSVDILKKYKVKDSGGILAEIWPGFKKK